MTWQPLNSRIAGEAEAPYEGIPKHLTAPLWQWTKGFLMYRGEYRHSYITRLASMSRIALSPDGSPSRAFVEFQSACSKNDTLFLNAIDAVLSLLPSEYGNQTDRIEKLREELSIGGSTWTVSPGGASLTRRVDPTAQAAAETAMAPADSASAELGEAWQKAYGLSPDGSDAWDHAIKAVEHILQPVVSPLNQSATLGTIIRDLDAGKAKFSFVLTKPDQSEIDSVLGVLRLIWPNPDRHGGGASQAVTLDQARVVVHLAVAVVQAARDNALWKGP